MTRNQKPTPALAMSRRQALRRTLMGVSLGWLMPATPVTLLPSTAITYAVSGKKSGIRYTATATLRWQRNATRYIAALSASLLVFLKREQTSSGQVVAGLPAPRRFVDKGKRIRQADLDPVTQRIRYTEAGGAPWTADTQDRVSLFFALPAAVKRAQAAGLKQFGFPVTSANALAAKPSRRHWGLGRRCGCDASLTPHATHRPRSGWRVAMTYCLSVFCWRSQMAPS
jgi:hypothetical protein